MSANQPICEQLAKMANSGKLWQHTLPGRAPTQEEESHTMVWKYFRPAEPRRIYEIKDETGIHKYASFLNPDWGTCSDYRIWSLDSHADRVTPDMEASLGKDNADEDVDLSDAGARDEMVTIGGDNFVISTYYYFDLRTLKSAAIARDGYIDPICTFTSEERPQLVVRKAVDPRLCRRVSQGRLKPVTWEDHPVGSSLETPYGYGTQAPNKQVAIDLNMEGKDEMLGLFVESSGGGCGSTRILLKTDNGVLNELLYSPDDRYGKGVWGHDSYGGDDYDVQVFVENGKPYLLGKSKLVSLWGNHLKTWCEFDSLVQHNVLTVYKSVKH